MEKRPRELSPVAERVAEEVVAMICAAAELLKAGGHLIEPIELPKIGASSLPSAAEGHENHGQNYAMYRRLVIPQLAEQGIVSTGRSLSATRSRITGRGFDFTQHFFDLPMRVAILEERDSRGSAQGYKAFLVAPEMAQVLFNTEAGRVQAPSEPVHHEPYMTERFID